MGTKSQDTFMFQGCVCSLWVRCRCVAWVQQRVTTQTGCGSVCVCGWEGKKTTPVSCPPLYSPGKADILKVSGRRPVWIRLDRNSETDRGLYTYRQFTERIVYLRVCVWQNKGEACLVSVRQYLVARSVERPLALETHGTHLNFDLIHAKYWPCN